MAGRFPEAENLQQFYENLKAGKDSIRAVSADRLERTAMPFSEHYQCMAWLHDIEMFDHAFFRISRGEACNMDPHQRIALEIVYETLENAGYDPFSFAGSETAVYVGDVSLDYYQLAAAYDPTLLTGNLNAVLAGRISRFFDLHGEAVMIDTSCSSSLVAVHQACISLETGNAAQALVCGIKIRIFPAQKKPVFDVGIGSPDGKTRSYSSDAGGTGSGEAAGCILLKPLANALADKDNIHAVIRGTAVNQDAARSGSLTAPSSAAQAAVIRKAWKKAAVDPLSITFIEGHGTATRLGDPIEVEGIDLAFSAYTGEKQHCALSSVKANIGHTDAAAGIAGLIKTVLSLKHKKLFPAVNFNKPNPFIDFDHSHVFVNTVFRDWDVKNGAPRRAGVSAFGLSGTNCHIVLEEAPAVHTMSRESGERLYLFPVSGFSGTALSGNMKRLASWLAAGREHSLPEISYTLCAGRAHLAHRHMILAANVPELISQLEQPQTAAPAAAPRRQLYFVFSRNTHITSSLLERMCNIYPSFNAAVGTCRSYLPAGEHSRSAGFDLFCFQFAFFRLLEEKGVATKKLLGEGTGEVVINTLTGKLSLADAVLTSLQDNIPGAQDLGASCEKFASSIVKDDSIILELGPLCRISETIAAVTAAASLPVLSLDIMERDPLLDIIKQLYLSGYEINWSLFFDNEDLRKTALPGYAFDRVRCWIRETPIGAPSPSGESGNVTDSDTQVVTGTSASIDLPAIMEVVTAAWKSVLKQEHINADDDFFDLGGHSLNGTQVLNRLTENFGVSLEMDDLFEYGTVATLSEFILSRVAPVTASETVYDGIGKAPLMPHYPVTHAQKNFWTLDQLSNGLTAYNMPGAYMITGPLHIEAFAMAFSQLVQRHESLRTTFKLTDGEPRQLINDGSSFQFEIVDLRYTADNENEAMAQVKQQTAMPFDLAQGPLIRACLYRLQDEKALFFFTLHHIIADGWSMEVIARDVMALYSAAAAGRLSPLSPLQVQFCDYAVWLEEQLTANRLADHRQFWLNEFPDTPPLLQLPADFQRPETQGFNGDKEHLVLDQALREAVKSLARRNNSTVYMTVLACINLLLCKTAGQYDMVIGLPSSGRNYPGLEDQVGLFLNTLAVRLKRDPAETLDAVVELVAGKLLQCTRHQVYPFDTLLRDLSYKKPSGHNSLFDVGFTHNTLGAVSGYSSTEDFMTAPELEITPVSHGFKSVKADLWFHLTETEDQLFITLDYNTDIFLPATAGKLLSDLQTIFYYITGHPGDTLQQLLNSMQQKEQDDRQKMQRDLRQRNLERLVNIGGKTGV